MRRRLPLLVVAAAILAPISFVLHHRLSLRLPRPGATVRTTHRPAVAVETVETERSIARLLELRDEDGPVTTAWLRLPRTLDPEHRILLTYVGHRTGRKILQLVPERDDVVLMAMQYAGTYRHRTLREKLAIPRVIREAVDDTVAGGMLAVAELERRGFEPSRLTLLGVSAGSFFAVLHGAYDEAVPRVLVVHGGAHLPRVLATVYRERGRPWTGRLVGALAWIFLDPLDSVHHVGRIAPREFTLIAARGDAYFPEESARALYAAALPPKSIAWTEGDHVRSKRLDIVDELIVTIDAYLDGTLELEESQRPGERRISER